MSENPSQAEQEALDAFSRHMQRLGWDVSSQPQADDDGWRFDLSLGVDGTEWFAELLNYADADVDQDDLVASWIAYHKESDKNLILIDPGASAIVNDDNARFHSSVLIGGVEWKVESSVDGLDEFIRVGLPATRGLPIQVLDVLVKNGMAVSPEAADILRSAAFLLKDKKAEQTVLSSTTLFFAAVELGRQQTSNELFCSQLFHYIDDHLAKDYEDIRDSFFVENANFELTSIEADYSFPDFGLSGNVVTALSQAKGRSLEIDGGPTSEPIDLVESLLAAKDTGLVKRLRNISALPRIQEFVESFRDSAHYESPGTTEPSDSVSTHATSDAATVDDKLGYSEYARAIYHFLKDPRTEPPLTISIQAPWGGGKTSLMRMVQVLLDPGGYEKQQKLKGQARNLSQGAEMHDVIKELRGLDSKRAQTTRLDLDQGICATVWFNAWRYESSDQIWAGLAESIIRGVTDRLNPVERELFLLRLHLNRIDSDKVRYRFYDAVFSRFIGNLQSIWGLIGLGLLAIGSAFWNQTIPVGTSSLAIPVGISSYLAAGFGLLVALVNARFAASKEPAKLKLSEYVDVPNYSEKLGFVHHVTEDLRRVFELLPEKKGDSPEEPDRQVPLAIFIDDLDRCSPSKVADVFEAINLFVAGEFPNCYILIGMDTEVVAAALEQAHKDVISRLPPHARRVPIGWRFMDKFVQLPFVIPPIDDAAIIDYAKHLAAAEDKEAREVQRRAAGDEARKVEARIRESLDRGEDDSKIIDDAARAFSIDTGEADEKAAEESRRLAEQRLESIKRQRYIDQRAAANRSDNEKIEQLLRRATNHLSSNPRELKRLVNVYRFYFNLRLARQSRSLDVPTDEQLQNWLILSLAWPEVVRWVRRGFADPGEATDRSESPANGGVVGQRLAVLEALAAQDVDVQPGGGEVDSLREEWSTSICETFDLADDTPWLADRRLFAFFRYLGRSDEAERVSEGAGRGFW